jgi:hypothetical protein
MANQFDLEDGIMDCWGVTDELDLLLEELMENSEFTQDQTSNFVLGLSTIYGSKFQKLFRTFGSFLKDYYRMNKEREEALNEVDRLREEIELAMEANELLAEEQPETLSLDQLFDEEEERLRILDENDRLDLIEDEFSRT